MAETEDHHRTSRHRASNMEVNPVAACLTYAGYMSKIGVSVELMLNSRSISSFSK